MSEPTAGQSPRSQAERSLALIRLAALPVIFAGERLIAHPEAESGPFDEIFVAAALYAAAALALAYTQARLRLPVWMYATLDLGFICALTYTSGGPFSQLRYAFFLLPLGAALFFRPRHTAAASLASILAYLAISLLHPAGGSPAVEFEVAQAFYLAWTGIAATVLAHLLARRSEKIEALAASRGRLVAQALDAEDRERRRLAEALHDEAIQNLLAARQELAAADGGKADVGLVQAGLERTIKQLREAVFDLHPYVREHAGLPAALEAVAERHAHRGGFRVELDVDPAATGAHDQLLFSIARELIANATKHADARTLTVSVRRNEREVVLEVADDGSGLEAGRLDEALHSGHIGLASCAERVEAVGGEFQITSSRGHGTRVRAAFPLAARESAPSDRMPADRRGRSGRRFLRGVGGREVTIRADSKS